MKSKLVGKSYVRPISTHVELTVVSMESLTCIAELIVWYNYEDTDTMPHVKFHSTSKKSRRTAQLTCSWRGKCKWALLRVPRANWSNFYIWPLEIKQFLLLGFNQQNMECNYFPIFHSWQGSIQSRCINYHRSEYKRSGGTPGMSTTFLCLRSGFCVSMAKISIYG